MGKGNDFYFRHIASLKSYIPDMSYPSQSAARFSRFLSYLMALAWLLQLLDTRHLLTQILIRSVTLSLSHTHTYISIVPTSPCLSIQVGVIPDHPLPTSFPKDEEGFCKCLQDPTSTCHMNRIQLFAR